MSALSIRHMNFTLQRREHQRAAQKLTRKEELEVELFVVEGAIRNAEENPDLLSAEFLNRQLERKAEILAELELYKEVDE